MPNYACPRKHFYIKKGFTILVVLVDRLSCIASACYVVYSTWIFNSKRSSHRNNYRLINLIFQDLTPITSKQIPTSEFSPPTTQTCFYERLRLHQWTRDQGDYSRPLK